MEAGYRHGNIYSGGDWTVMAHGSVSAQYTDHSGPRGDDKLYLTSMLMLLGRNATARLGAAPVPSRCSALSR